MHRWRTQPGAISSVNCRIQWIIESLNANGALGFSQEHVCLSVGFQSIAHRARAQASRLAAYGLVRHWGVTAIVCRVPRSAERPGWCGVHAGATAEAKISLSSFGATANRYPSGRKRRTKAAAACFLPWPQIRQGYPLNLSILISGGKETNKDSPSNGEWSGISSNLKSPLLATANCSFEKRFLGGPTAPKLLGTARHRGWQPRLWRGRPLSMCFQRVGLFGNAAQNGW